MWNSACGRCHELTMMDVGKCRISRKYILKGARACCVLCNLKCRVEVAGVSHVEHPRARSCWLLVTQINLEGEVLKRNLRASNFFRCTWSLLKRTILGSGTWSSLVAEAVLWLLLAVPARPSTSLLPPPPAIPFEGGSGFKMVYFDF